MQCRRKTGLIRDFFIDTCNLYSCTRDFESIVRMSKEPKEKVGPWRRNSSCVAHRILTEMFEKQEITTDDTAAAVHKTHEEFLKYKPEVFRGVFNELRARFGLMCKLLRANCSFSVFQIIYIYLNLIVRGKRTSKEVTGSTESEAGSCSGSKKTYIEENSNDVTSKGEDSRFICRNLPFTMSIYRDPETQGQKVFLVIALPGGSTDVEFTLVGSGTGTSTAKVSFSWPKFAYDVEALLAKQIKGGLNPLHPKILSHQAELENNRDNVEETPRGEIEVTLPIPVQTSRTSYTFTGGNNEDGSLMLIAEMAALQNTYIAKLSDKKVKFEKL
jgi:hypothetical protein